MQMNLAKVGILLLVTSSWLIGGCAPTVQSEVVAQGGPEASLLARMRAACGGEAWDHIQGWHESGRVEMRGQAGLTYEAFHDVRTLRTTYAQRLNGKIIRLGGFDGTKSWRVGPDGKVQTVEDPAQLRKTRRDMYLSSAGYYFPERFPATFELVGAKTVGDRSFDVLRVTPANAETAELWVDRQTHRIGRVVAGDEFAEGSDYRMFGKVCGPTRLRQGDGNPANELILHVEAVDTGLLDPAVFVPSPTAVSP